MSNIILGNYSSIINQLSDANILWIMLKYNTIYLATKLGNIRERLIALDYYKHLYRSRDYSQRGLSYCCGLKPVEPPIEEPLMDEPLMEDPPFENLQLSFTYVDQDLSMTSGFNNKLTEYIYNMLKVTPGTFAVTITDRILSFELNNLSDPQKNIYSDILDDQAEDLRDVIIAAALDDTDEHCTGLYVRRLHSFEFIISADVTFGAKSMTMDEINYVTCGQIDKATEYISFTGSKPLQFNSTIVTLMELMNRIKHLNNSINFIYGFLMLNYNYTILSNNYVKSLAQINALEKLIGTEVNSFNQEMSGAVSGSTSAMIIDVFYHNYFGHLPNNPAMWGITILSSLKCIAKVIRLYGISPYSSGSYNVETIKKIRDHLDLEFGIGGSLS
tara:strand:+ start:2453 stop:3613 length:1161 start_codon:yes stop_codon:yes gene_type:complete